ncbi:MAG TPA: class I SAM-dependent methyltransferase [Coleofasciculaceae cyanobacterium]
MLGIIEEIYQKLKFNSSRRYLEDWLIEAAQSVSAEDLILDAGAGNSPYKSLFVHAKYESADFCQLNKEYGEITYVCDLTSIPVEDCRYDKVICNQVLEHVSEPKAVLKELHRVLKPKAELWLSAPFFYEEHETPYDYYRYTQFGFKHLLESVGFRIEKIEWLEGYYGTLSYQLETAFRNLSLNPKMYGNGLAGISVIPIIFGLKIVFAISSILFANLDIRYKNVWNGQCKNYTIIAIK